MHANSILRFHFYCYFSWFWQFAQHITYICSFVSHRCCCRHFVCHQIIMHPFISAFMSLQIDIETNTQIIYKALKVVIDNALSSSFLHSSGLLFCPVKILSACTKRKTRLAFRASFKEREHFSWFDRLNYIPKNATVAFEINSTSFYLIHDYV